MAPAASEGCAEHARRRLLGEMVRETLAATGGADGAWAVLVVDPVTVKVLSTACKMSDLVEEGVSLVEDLHKGREPQTSTPAIYFITPSPENVARLVGDFEGTPKYASAHVFFSSAASAPVLATIRSASGLLDRIVSLKELNLEYLATESRAFVTGHPGALKTFYSDNAEASPSYAEVLESVSVRLASMFASMHEVPDIRYLSAKRGDGSGAARLQLPARLADALHAKISALQGRMPGMPAAPSCDLLIVDRTVDVVAPIIHEWTYEAMCRDLLSLDGNLYRYDVETNNKTQERKEALLGEHDPLWRELRHLNIADVLLRLSDKTQKFGESNKAARGMRGRAQEDQGAGNGMTTGQIRRLVESLPQYRDELAKLAVHTSVAGELNAIVQARKLSDVGKCEQDLVFGHANSKDLLKAYETAKLSGADLPRADKLRMLMCYLTTHPEKLDTSQRMKWVEVAGLTADDMNTVSNLELLGVAVNKKASSSSMLTFSKRKTKGALRKERPAADGEGWDLGRFQPELYGIVEELARGELSLEDFPRVGTPTTIASSQAAPAASSARSAASARSARTGSSWAKKPAASADTAGAALGDIKLQGKRIFVFVLGGATFSEVRCAHELSAALGREVVVGATSVDTPAEFLANLGALCNLDDVDIGV